MATQMDTHKTTIGRHLIGGEWRESGELIASVNPSTGEDVGFFHAGGLDEAEAGIAAARAALKETDWARNPELRARALNQLADAFDARLGELAATLSSEGGKLLGQAAWEVSITGPTLRYSAAAALTQIAGRSAEVPYGVSIHTTLEPVGVVGIISPWNSPVFLTARALAPALAAGCTTVIKLPAQTALTNAMFAEIVASVEAIPPGVVNVFTESGNEGAPALVRSPDVDVIAYTGSTQVGRIIAEQAAPTLKGLNLELGGKTPLVVLDDADLDAVVPMLVQALVTMNGQFCVTGSRVLVQRSIADELRPRLVEALRNVRLGAADDPDAQMGPLIDHASVERIDRLVEEAEAYGQVLVRGGAPDDDALAAGAFFRPALVEIEDLDAPLVQQEIFGPVQTFELFDDDADAVRRANGTEYGLAASVFSKNESRARAVGRDIDAGGIWINLWGLVSDHFDEGGMKQSGVGRLRGPHQLQDFQEVKSWTQLTPPL